MTMGFETELRPEAEEALLNLEAQLNTLVQRADALDRITNPEIKKWLDDSIVSNVLLSIVAAKAALLFAQYLNVDLEAASRLLGTATK
ncbi:MAG: hypothetical protein HYS57_00050 [Parcubacteria group bacterium]|nr:hypothetical protein [Parcubacteria group bacterium]